jgi:hypothetical protein
MHHPTKCYNEYFWSNSPCSIPDRSNNFLVSIENKLFSKRLPLIGTGSNLSSFIYHHNHIGVNTLGKKISWKYEEDCGIGLQLKLASNFDCNLGIRLLKNRKRDDTVFLNFSKD